MFDRHVLNGNFLWMKLKWLGDSEEVFGLHLLTCHDMSQTFQISKNCGETGMGQFCYLHPCDGICRVLSIKIHT